MPKDKETLYANLIGQMSRDLKIPLLTNTFLKNKNQCDKNDEEKQGVHMINSNGKGAILHAKHI